MNKMNKKEKLNALIKKQQAIVDKAKAENGRSLNEDEQRSFDSLQSQIDELKRDIEPDGAPAQNGGDSQRNLAAGEERQRCIEINAICRSFDVDPTAFINDGSSLDSVRAAILERLQSNNGGIVTSGSVRVEADEADKFRNAATDALMLRSGITLSNPSDGARDLRGMSLKGLAIECMEKEGCNEKNLHLKSADEIYRYMMRGYLNPTSAFPSIVEQTINKSYQEGHKRANTTYRRIAEIGTLSDFKKNDNYWVAGTAGEFLEVPEGGELKSEMLTDAKRPSRQLKTYGRQFTMTRQAFINDDIGMVTTIPMRHAEAADKTINKQVYTGIYNNIAMPDGIKIFDAKHNNVITSGTAPTFESIQAGLKLLQLQKDEFGEPCLIQPKAIVVPIGYGMTLKQIFHSQTINTAGNTQAFNPLSEMEASIDIIEDATLNALAGSNACPWFIVGDGNFVEVDFLNGNETPEIRLSEKSGTLGLVWDIFLDWGVAYMDHREAVRNNGVKL